MPPPLVVMILLPLKREYAGVAERSGRAPAVGGPEGFGGVSMTVDVELVAHVERSARSRRTGRRGRR